MTVSQGRPRLDGDRPLLSEDDVVAAGVLLTRKHGLGVLTVQGVADELGVSAPAIYHWVRSRDVLRAKVADRVIGEIDAAGNDADDPRERIRGALLAVRLHLRRHPGVAEHWISQKRPPLAGRRSAERVLVWLIELGLPPRDAVRAFTVLYTYAMGHLMLPTADAPLRASGRQPRRTGPLSEAYAALGELDPEEEFVWGLDILLDGFIRYRSSRPQT